MSCVFQAGNPVTIEWYRGGSTPVSDGDPDVTITISSAANNYSSELTIDPVSFDHCGDYHCIATLNILASKKETTVPATLSIVGELCVPPEATHFLWKNDCLECVVLLCFVVV